MTNTTAVRCPFCGSIRIWKDGLRRFKERIIQRYICRDCGHRFSDPSTGGREKIINENNQSIIHQISVLDRSKNLVQQKSQQERVSGTTKQTEKKNMQIVFKYAWWMKKQGYAESTITSRVKLLKVIIKRGAKLGDPETVKDVIARQKWCPGRKENAVHAYTSFLKMNDQKWKPPKYKRIQKLPWIPLESEIDQLIAGCSHRIATFLQLLKETGMRPGEAWILRWINIDFEKSLVYVTPEKGSNPRVLKFSNKLYAMLKALPKKGEYIFRNGLLRHFGGGFRQQRKRIASKLGNQRINRITFKTFRHFKATLEYAKTKDILHVKELLGHKKIENTLKYTHLVNFERDEFVSKVARTTDEACKLVEAGFDFICTTPENLMLFKKRK
jgi:integrase